MRLSTTVNFFIYSDDGSYQKYKDDLKNYAELGFKNLDCIFCSAGNLNSPLRTERWKDWAKVIREEADRLGITFVQTHVPFYNFCNPEKGINQEIEDIVTKSIICTNILGASWTVSHPGTDFSCNLRSVTKEKNVNYFARLLELGEKQNVGICIENMADFPGQGFKRSYCATVEELGDLVDTLGEQFTNVGICWDFGHANLVYDSQASCLRYLGNRIKVTHVHDNYGKEDQHQIPFYGNINWKENIKSLHEINYKGDFSFEVKRLPNDIPYGVKNLMYQYMKSVGEYLLSI